LILNGFRITTPLLGTVWGQSYRNRVHQSIYLRTDCNKDRR